MSRLGIMLTQAFPRCMEKSFFECLPWSISFSYGTWDTYFDLFYFNKRIVSGNTSDKILTIHSDDAELVQKVLDDFAVVLPKYKAKPLNGGTNHDFSSK